MPASAADSDGILRLTALAGWRRRLTALGLGAVLAAALPPFHLLPGAVVAFSGLAWLISGHRRGAGAFLDGWWFGCGFSAAAFYWIANALLVDPERHAWLYPLALLAIAAGFGLFPAAAAGLAGMVPGARARIVALGVAWLVLEWVRSWLLTGFPWNLVGSSLALSDSLIQGGALGGPWLLGAIVLVASLAPAAVAPAGRFTPRRAASGLMVSIAVIALAWAAGELRLQNRDNSPGPKVRLVQPHIEQHLKWERALLEDHFARHIALSSLAPAGEPPVAVIWPEAAIPPTLLVKPAVLSAFAAAAPPGGVIMAGAIRAVPGADGALEARNSLLVFSGKGPVTLHDKYRLVPFGEYVPLRGILPIDTIAPGSRDMGRGPGPATIRLASLPDFGVLICYEIIFPTGITDPTQPPRWLLNITNDAWFGLSSGPYQHFQAARLRAVEQGLPVVRVANTGISGVIDPLGRVVASMPLGHSGILDVALPAPLEHPTPWSRYGNWTLLVILLPGLAFIAAALIRR